MKQITNILKQTKPIDKLSEKHKEAIELRFLKRKIAFVDIVLVLLVAPVMFFLYQYTQSTQTMMVYGLFFVVLFMINFAFYAYEDYFNSLKLSIYITALGIYVIAASLIIEIQTPSIFTVLFLAYAIVSVYQDMKATILNNFALFFIGTIVIWRYPEIFQLQESARQQHIYVFLFLLIFAIMLSISSFVLIKRKMFFYKQLAQIKETELRTINIVFDLKEAYTGKPFIFDEYYQQLDTFSEYLSKEIHIDNVFKERIQLLKDAQSLSDYQLMSKYPNIDRDDISELKQLELSAHSKMHYLLFKTSQSKDYEITKKALISDTQFKSFNHRNDHIYVKIIAFAVFYVLLKTERPHLPAIDDNTLKVVLKQSEIYHLIHPKIRKLFFENAEVLNKIVEDAFSKKVKK